MFEIRNLAIIGGVVTVLAGTLFTTAILAKIWTNTPLTPFEKTLSTLALYGLLIAQIMRIVHALVAA